MNAERPPWLQGGLIPGAPVSSLHYGRFVAGSCLLKLLWKWRQPTEPAPGAAEPPRVCLQLCLAGPDHRNTPPLSPHHSSRN